jgi:alkanesulfonate monooxygenase SsuD/methylene tetrahydromethanopterin reductase-like flavin-dependent oxidoreductase (luciferase family)
MKFGVFYELQLPRPWSAHSEADLFNNALNQVEIADRVGYDYAWFVEHHFMEEYSHCSAPEVMLGAASQRTKNIRLGHGIIQLTTNFPARVAERVATLDLISNGRVELGIGEGSSVTELHPFGRRFRDKREIWEEAVRATLPMFWSESWEFEGKYFSFPRRNVVPKPLQKPHPPLWVACSQLDTIKMAGERGLGALGFQFIDADSARAWRHAYYNAYMRNLNKLCDYQTNPNLAVVAPFMCCETDEEAQAKMDGWSFFQFALVLYSKEGPFEPGTINFWERYQEWKAKNPAEKIPNRGLVGSPETIRRKLREFEAAHIDQVILLNQAGKNSHADICASLELFAREVMPEFKAREPQHQEWKSAVLRGEIELEDVDTTPYNAYTLQTPVSQAATGTLKASDELQAVKRA